MLAQNITEWTIKVLGSGSRVVATEPLLGIPGSEHPPWMLRVARGGSTTAVVLRTMPVGQVHHPGFAREVQALTLAENHAVRAPRVIAADVDGAQAGDPVFLVTAMPGSSLSPTDPSPAWLQSYGAATAALRNVRIEPIGDLLLSAAGIDVYGAAADRRRLMRYERATDPERSVMREELCAEGGCDHAQAHEQITRPTGGRSALMEAAEEQLGELILPTTPTILVHGDLHPGNTMWIGDELTAMVDWDAACVGHEGIDLGNARLSAALRYGLGAADQVLAGWCNAAGTTPQPEILAYGDARAALNIPARTSSPQATARRDTFLQAALRTLGLEQTT